MQSPFKHRRATLRAVGPGILLVMAAGLSGCYSYVEEAGLPEVFCGILYDCGSHSDNNRGGGQTASGTSSESTGSSSSGGTGSTGGQGATTPN